MSVASRAIVASLDAIPEGAFAGDEVGRLQAVAAATRLKSRLQTPSEHASTYMFDHAVVYACIQTLSDIGLWDAWNIAGGGEKTVDELVKLAKAIIAPNLLRRMLRLLNAAVVIEETDVDTYKPTTLSKRLGEDLGLLFQAGTDLYNDASSAMPQFLKQTGYIEVNDSKNTPFTVMHSNPDHLDFFTRCRRDPKLYESFSMHMADWTRAKPDWTDTFDTRALREGADLSKGPLVVDMGAHYGGDILRLLNKYPDLPAGALVLQDLPEVIEVVKTKVDLAKITPAVHDIFTEQPVKGARAYFMHAVLHDWPDHACLDIFDKLKPAMDKGYSKLLIVDIVIPPKGASISQCVMDLQMMSLLAAKERTQDAWIELLTSAGFSNIKFHQDARAMECVIEADLV